MIWICFYIIIVWRLVHTESLALNSSSSSNQKGVLEKDNDDALVQVWDDVLTEELCQILHQQEQERQERQQPHYLLKRPLNKNDEEEETSLFTLLERVLDGILTELGDDSMYVEYWSRTEWKHLEAHIDIDEYLAKEFPSTSFQYPNHGHVLYLQVGTDVRGPTCIISPSTVTTVPAVQGRLTRFRGTSWHTVPRPTNRWTIPFVKGAPKHTPTTQWGRHVVLFNTWNNKPPHNIHPISSSSSSSSSTTDITDNPTEQSCNDSNIIPRFSMWNKVQPQDHPKKGDDDWGTAKIWLLGNEQRRQYPMRTVPIQMPLSILEDALYDPSNIHSIPYQSSQNTPFEQSIE